MTTTFFRVLLFWALTVLALIPGSALWPESAVLSIGTAAILTLLLSLLFTRWDRIRLSDAGIVPKAGSFRRFLEGMLWGVGLVLLQEAALGVSGVATLTFRGEGLVPVASHLALYFLVAWREEMAFRGYLLKRLTGSFSILYALLIMTALFCVEHFWGGMNWWQALFGVGAGGLLFGVAAIRSGGIALPMGIHTVWNFGQWCFGQKDGAGIWQWQIAPELQGQADFWAYAAYFAGYALVILVLWFGKKDDSARS